MLIPVLSLMCLVVAVPLQDGQEEWRAVQVVVDGTMTEFSVAFDDGVPNDVEATARQFCVERDIHPQQECGRALAERWRRVHKQLHVPHTCWDQYQANIDATKVTKFVPGKSIMMDPSSVKMLCGLLTPTTRVLEWGSGGSTVFFSQFVESWDSIEHNSQWYKEMGGYTASMANVRMYTAPHSWNGNDDGTYAEFKDYVELPAKWERQFDVVLVDGRARVPCARSAIYNSLLEPNGIVVVHDWERVQYKVLLLDQFRLVQEDTADRRHLGVLRPLTIATRIADGRHTGGTVYGGG